MTINFRGYLFQDDGDPVSGATIQLLETGTTTVEASTTTDSDGLWYVNEADQDRYDVKITSGGSVRYIRWDDQISLKEIDVRNNTGATTPAATLSNITNAVANQVAVFSGANSTKADDDEIYLSFKMHDSAGNLDEFARMTVVATDVTSGSEDGQFEFDVLQGGSLIKAFTIASSTAGAQSIDFNQDSITFGTGTAATDITLTFDAESADGVLTWMEDEDYFKFSDDLLMNSTERINFYDTAIYIYSSTDGQLDLVADTEIQIAATTIDINGAVAFDGALTGITNITLSGTLSDGNYTFDTSGNLSGLGTLGSGNITSTGTVQGTVVTATTGFAPDASDGAYLGTASLEFSDLFLADGAVINLGDDQDVTLTHYADNGVLLNSTRKIYFEDGSNYDQSIGSSGSGVTTLASVSGITLDSGADIILDAGGADVYLKDDGTLFGTLNNNSGELLIKSSSSGTTAATFSGANVTFAGTVDATTDFTIGSTVITDGVITDSSGLQLAADLDIDGAADISGDLTLSGGADGALQFTNAGENSIKIPDNQSSALIIEEADNAYITFNTTNSSEAITVAKATTFSSTIAAATGSTIGNLTLANGSITDSSGALDFGNETLTTTGVVTAAGFTIGSAAITEAELEILDGASGRIFSYNSEVTSSGGTFSTNEHRLFIPPGTTVTSAIVLSGNGIVLRVGAQCDIQTTVTLSGDNCSLICENGVDLDGIIVSGDFGFVDGGGWETLSNGGTANHGIDVSGDDGIVQNISAQTTAGGGSSYDAVSSNGTNRNTFERIKVHDSDRFGFFMGNVGSECQISNCTVLGSDAEWIILNQERSRVIGNYCIASGADGIEVDDGGDNSVVMGNVCKDSTLDVIQINSAAEDVVVVGNRVDGSILDNSGTSTVASNDATAF
jgi:hypothetical protein